MTPVPPLPPPEGLGLLQALVAFSGAAAAGVAIDHRQQFAAAAFGLGTPLFTARAPDPPPAAASLNALLGRAPDAEVVGDAFVWCNSCHRYTHAVAADGRAAGLPHPDDSGDGGFCSHVDVLVVEAPGRYANTHPGRILPQPGATPHAEPVGETS